MEKKYADLPLHSTTKSLEDQEPVPRPRRRFINKRSLLALSLSALALVHLARNQYTLFDVEQRWEQQNWLDSEWKGDQVDESSSSSLWSSAAGEGPRIAIIGAGAGGESSVIRPAD